MRIATNKNYRFFCHSRKSGNPVAMVMLLAFLFGIAFAPVRIAFAYDSRCDDFTYFQAHEAECLASGATGNWGQGNGDSGGISTISGLIFRINALLNTILPFLVGLAVFIVIWGIFGYISHSADEEKREEAKKYILWGVIFIFFMLSIWGLVNVLNNSFNLKKTPVNVPSVFPTSS